MPRLIWAPAALRDVQRLYRFLAPEHIDAAKRAIKAIREGVLVVGHQPGMGRPVPDMEPEFREWMIDFGDSGFVALYRHDSSTTVILAVRHQRELDY